MVINNIKNNNNYKNIEYPKLDPQAKHMIPQYRANNKIIKRMKEIKILIIRNNHLIITPFQVLRKS